MAARIRQIEVEVRRIGGARLTYSLSSDCQVSEVRGRVARDLGCFAWNVRLIAGLDVLDDDQLLGDLFPGGSAALSCVVLGSAPPAAGAPQWQAFHSEGLDCPVYYDEFGVLAFKLPEPDRRAELEALAGAAQHGDGDAVQAHFAHGRGAEFWRDAGLAFCYAMDGGQTGVVRLLLSIYDTDDDDERKQRALADLLLWAADKELTDAMELLLDHGAQREAPHNAWGHTALHHAARVGNLRAVQTLLTYRPPAQRSTAGFRRHVEMVDRMLEARNANGETPLMLAALNGHRGVAERLLEEGASADAENAMGLSAVAIAKFRGHTALGDFIKARWRSSCPLPC